MPYKFLEDVAIADVCIEARGKDLNELFEQNELNENFTSTVKRRENTLTNLTTKLSLITGCNENDIIEYRKNPNDKRVKEIKLKENFIKIK